MTVKAMIPSIALGTGPSGRWINWACHESATTEHENFSLTSHMNVFSGSSALQYASRESIMAASRLNAPPPATHSPFHMGLSLNRFIFNSN